MQIEHGKGCGPTGDACDSALCTCIIMNLYKYVNDICLEWSWDTMQSGPDRGSGMVEYVSLTT